MRTTLARSLVAATLLVIATTSPARAQANSIEAVARDAVVEALQPALAARGATAAVHVSAPDARRAPAPCGQFLGFIPPGARLVGKTVVGVRCADGSGWQAFVTADIRVDAPVWQATHALRAGDPLAAGDVVLGIAALTPADLDVAAATGRAAASRGLASLDGRQPPPIGRTVQRPVGAGRALAAADVREQGRVNAGESVRVVYQGDGFSVASEGRTVSPADPGAPVQIRLASGAVVSGTLRGDHQVELAK